MSKTVQISISAAPTYSPEQSDPAQQKFVWSYEVTISNSSDQIIQLLHRYWRIIDMTGKVEEIHGAGVVGLQPLIKPGREFIYKSFCQLSTPNGSMEGCYEMQNIEEQHFLVEVPKFALAAPTEVGQMYRERLH